MAAILAAHERSAAAFRREAAQWSSRGSAPKVFVGEFDRSVDGAGRIALPADFRDDLGGTCYLTCDPDGFVKITTADNFRAEADFLREQVRAGVEPPSALRAFGTRTQKASIDKQGRITLDEATRTHAGLRNQAVVAGSIDHLEVWRPSRYRQVDSEHAVMSPSRVWTDEDDDPAGDDAGAGGTA